MSWSFSVRAATVAAALAETNQRIEAAAAHIPEPVQEIIRGSVSALSELEGREVTVDTWGHLNNQGGTGMESLKIEVKHVLPET